MNDLFNEEFSLNKYKNELSQNSTAREKRSTTKRSGKAAFKKSNNSQKRKFVSKGGIGPTPDVLLFVGPKHR